MRIGGTEQVIKNLIEGSDNETYDMSIFCLEEPIGPFGKMLKQQGIAIASVNRNHGFDRSLIGHIRSHIKQHDIDVIHCHQYTPWVYGTLGALGTGTRIVFTEHGRFYPDRSSWKRRFINPLLAKFTNRITAISKATRQALVDYEFIPEHRIEVIYNGILPLTSPDHLSEKVRQEFGIPASHTIIGTIARLDPIKNHRMMLSAFSKVLERHPDTTLVIVGDGDERHIVEQTIDKLAIRDNVIVTGYIPNPVHYLACMDIFLLSSLSEGTSMTLLEAMSLAKPCVVTNAGGNPEIIADKVNGIVTENDNSEAFASAIVEILNNDVLMKAMGAASYDRYKQKFSASAMTDAYQNIYTDITAHTS